jgi:uncharacterized protein (DUF4415 family)
MNMVRFKRSEIPVMSKEREAELKALSERVSDAMVVDALDDDFWAKAAPSPFYKAKKVHASIRIDADVIAWLKSQGKGYQSKINSILRAEMLKSHFSD